MANSDDMKALADTPPGPALSALLARYDPTQLTADEAIPVLRAWSRQRAHDHARLAATMARVAALSRHTTEPEDWAGSEIAAALTWSEAKTGRELEFAETLAGLPLVAAAFDTGRIDHGKAWVFTDVLGSAELSPAQTEAVCALYVPLAPGLTAGQLRHRLLRAVLAVDPEWAGRRYRRAVAGRRVCGYLSADGTATITASGLPAGDAAAACARVDTLAEQLVRAGYPGTLNQIRAEVFVRLLDGRLTGLNTEQIIATLLADTPPAQADPAAAGPAAAGPAAAGPATADSATADSATADSAAAAAAAAGADPAVADPAGVDPAVADPAPADSGQHAAGDLGAGEPGVGVGVGVDPEPARGGAQAGVEICVGLPTLLGLDHRPADIPGWGPVLPEVARAIVARQHHSRWRFAILDDSGYLLLAGTLRRRPHPDPQQATPVQVEGGIVELHLTVADLLRLAADPAAHPAWTPLITELSQRFADRHRLLAALDAHPDTRLVRGALLRHIQVRDRRCVAPGCRRPARHCDADHTLDHAAGGTTTAANTAPLCPRHHALKHHGGWRLEQPQPGRFHWTSPLGQRYDTRGESIRPPLPEPLPRPPIPDQPPGSGPPDLDGPTFDPTPNARPRPSSPPPPRPPRWRPSHKTREDPDDPAPF